MDYGSLFARAWDILWKHKFLILLGVIVALGGAGSGGGNQGRMVFSGDDIRWGEMPAFQFEEPFRNLDLPLFAVGGILALAAGILLLGLVFWAAGTLARGGLISAVNEIEAGRPADFSSALRAGWDKGWRLIGIGLVPAIPGLVLALAGVVTFAVFGGFSALTQGEFPFLEAGAFIPVLALTCLLVPLMLLLYLLSTFANRACMLEDLGLISSYRRGFEVLGENLGPALLLFLLQVALSFGIGIMMIVPGILIAMCCLLWPLLLLIQGAFSAYYSTLWTLAWNEWAGSKRALVSPEP